MTNSLTIFVLALLFIAFGYVSIVRIVYKQNYRTRFKVNDNFMVNIGQLISQVGQGSVFACLCATSLLLFWGWGIALLWLIAFHLIIETFVNIQTSKSNSQLANTSQGFINSIHNRVNPEINKSSLPSFIWRTYLLLLAAIIIALLVNLISEQSGVVFFIAILLPAHLLLRNNYTGKLSIFSIALAFLMLLLGVLLSDKLGFSIYNSFEPLKNLVNSDTRTNYFPWLNLNSASIITLGLIIIAFNWCHRATLRSDISNIGGALTLIILCVFIARLAWLRPIIDAPLTISETANSNLPNFASLSLFLFAGLSLLLFREEEKIKPKAPIHLRNITDSLNNKEQTTDNFFSLQLSSFVQLLLNVLIVLLLACALGIGAWNTHYADWNSTTTLTAHFDLTINTILDLLDPRADTSSRLYNILISGVIFCGFALLLNILSNLTQLNENTKNNPESPIRQLGQSNLMHGLIIYVISCLLINTGISIDLWLIVGMLAWLLISSLMLQYILDTNHDKSNNKLQSSFLCVLIVGGVIQVLWNLITWITSSHYSYALIAGIILLFAAKLWKNKLPKLFAPFKKQKNEQLFD